MLTKDYIPHEKLRLHLKMGRQLAQFVGIGTYFDSITFDWVLLSGTEPHASIRLIRSLDEGDEYHCDVRSFSTVQDDDPEEIKQFSGPLSACLEWLEQEQGGNPHQFIDVRLIDQEYAAYVQHCSSIKDD